MGNNNTLLMRATNRHYYHVSCIIIVSLSLFASCVSVIAIVKMTVNITVIFCCKANVIGNFKISNRSNKKTKQLH